MHGYVKGKNFMKTSIRDHQVQDIEHQIHIVMQRIKRNLKSWQRATKEQYSSLRLTLRAATFFLTHYPPHILQDLLIFARLNVRRHFLR